MPSHDPRRLVVPKALVALVKVTRQERRLSMFQFMSAHLAPSKRVRHPEFADLPKTISGKIRRVELRAGARSPTDFWEDDFPELR